MLEAIPWRLSMEAPEDATKLMLANLQNVFSYVQTQDGVLASVGKIYKRMDELATMAMDPIKTDADRALYDKEFQELRTLRLGPT
jgi:flagellin-like hook-associated protein FlgL